MLRIKTALRSIGRILTFRATRGDIKDDVWPLLLIGVLLTWAVGYGRWWDDPRDLPYFARMGYGSVLYVFVLSAILWIVSYPVAKERVGFGHVLAFVAATSLPGIVYALPVEAISASGTASAYNVAALIFVSTYRVALLVWFFRKILEMRLWPAIVATFLPISCITAVISLADLGHKILNMMGGFRGNVSQTAAEAVVLAIGYTSFCLAPFLLVAYIHFSLEARRAKSE